MEKVKTKMLPLAKIKANQQNPRVISESKLKKLINSLLVFPKMMSLRPITLDDDGFVLGGNMRLTALGRIAQMTWEELHSHVESLPEFNELSDGGREVLEFWETFLSKPQAEVQYASQLTESEKQQFIIKDNVSFGDWDYDELENWDQARLEDWGVDTLLPDFGSPESGGGNLPPELEGKDLSPDGLEKLSGDDQTAMQRVIICYKPEQENEILKLLHLEKIEKVVYHLDELPADD